MQIDNNKTEKSRAYNRFKWLSLTLIILYFVAGQVYPFFHIHHHNPHQQKEFDLCSDPFEQAHHYHQCCEQHRYCHMNLESDWHFVTIKIKDVKNTPLELFVIYPKSDTINSKICVFIYNYPFTNKTFQITSKLFNKAPPALI